MAQIPTVTAPQLTPPPEMNPAIAGRPGAALAGAADQFASVADFGIQVADRIKRAQDEGILLNAENQIESDIQKAHAQLQNWTDYTHADQLKQQTADALMEKYSEQYGNRPDLWRVIQPRLGKELNFYDAQVDTHAAKLTVDFNQAALMDTLGKSVDKAALIPTIEGQELEWRDFDMKANAMALNASITFTEANTLKKQVRSQTIQTQVERAANPLNPPEVMQAELDKLKQYEGKDYVPAEKLAEYQAHLGEALKVASRTFDEKGVAKKGDAVIATMSSDPTVKDPATGDIDYLKAAKKIDENPDLPTNVKKYVREEFEQRDTVQKHITNESNQKILDELQPRLYDSKNPLTSAEVKQRALLAPSQPGYIPREVESHLLTGLGQIQRENRSLDVQARQEARQAADDKSKNIAYDLLMNGGLLVDRSDLVPYQLKGLSKGDALMVWENKNLSKDQGWQAAVKLMDASPLYDHTTDEGRAKLETDTLNFARTVENKKLTGSAIVTELQNELHPKEETKKKADTKNMLDNLWQSFATRGYVYPVGSSTQQNAAPERPAGVPKDAIWNGEAKQWQLPSNPQQ